MIAALMRLNWRLRNVLTYLLTSGKAAIFCHFNDFGILRFHRRGCGRPIINTGADMSRPSERYRHVTRLLGLGAEEFINTSLVALPAFAVTSV